MSRPCPALKGHSVPESKRGMDVVRASKAIPAMTKHRIDDEHELEPKALLCTGHCGHCEVHPCQLHATV